MKGNGIFMKLKDGFILKNVAGNYIIVPVSGELVDLNAMITITGTGAFLWDKLEKGTNKDELIEAMTKEYDIDKETASSDIDAFLKQLTDNKMLDD